MDAEKGKKHLLEALELIDQAMSDLERGDRLDAIDALRMAISELEQSRAVHPLPIAIKFDGSDSNAG